MRISREWTWNNPHSGRPSHSMKVEFDITATTDRTNIFVEITNLRMTGWNGADPDRGTTQDHIVLSSTSHLPQTLPAPPRPIALPFPSDIQSKGAFAELATYLNNGSPQRYFWGNNSVSYTIPYQGDDTTVVYSLNSYFSGQSIAWSLGEFKVSLRELRYIPMEGKKNNAYHSFNAPGNDLAGKKGGYQTMWNSFDNNGRQSGQGKKNQSGQGVFAKLELE